VSNELPPRLARVTGRVLLGGEPLTAGKVLLKAPPGSHVTSTSAYIEDGTFTFPEAPIGPVTLAIDTESVKADIARFHEDGAPPPPGLRYVPIPRKYTSFDTSGLTLEVRPGTQTFDIQLDPR
jgi:hypothetical protein